MRASAIGERGGREREREDELRAERQRLYHIGAVQDPRRQRTGWIEEGSARLRRRGRTQATEHTWSNYMNNAARDVSHARYWLRDLGSGCADSRTGARTEEGGDHHANLPSGGGSTESMTARVRFHRGAASKTNSKKKKEERRRDVVAGWDQARRSETPQTNLPIMATQQPAPPDVS